MTRVTCSECKKETDVPFTPSPDRPVYCNDCFRKKRQEGPRGASRGGPRGGPRGQGGPREGRADTSHGFKRSDYPGHERFQEK